MSIARGFTLVLLLSGLWTLPAPLPAQSMQRARPSLRPDARQRLATWRAHSDSTVILVIASRPGANQSVARVVGTLGGAILRRNDSVSYLRARVPIDSVERVLDAAPIDAATVDRDATNAAFRWRQEPEISPPLPASRIVDIDPPGRIGGWREDPLNRPYSPLEDMGALRMRRENPTYDGRGVTIGHVESPVDLLSPELADAVTLGGQKTRKVVDVLTTILPGELGEGRSPAAADYPWVSMQERVMARDARFVRGDTAYAAPRSGSFRFGVFNGGRVCRLFDPAHALNYWKLRFDPPRQCPFGVLWDSASNEVWVDTDQDRSFSDETALRDYRIRFDVGTLGRDDTTTATRESYPFVVQTRADVGYVGIIVGMQSHSTMVATSAAGSKGAHGRFDGIAPGARIVNFWTSIGTVWSVTEGLIAAFSDPRVDIVVNEVFGDYGRDPLHDNRGPTAVILDRLVAKYNKLLAQPANNIPSDQSVTEPGRWGFATGATESQASWWINQGVRVPRADNHHVVGSWGPGGDASIHPTVLAPSGYLAGSADVHDATYKGKRGLYELPWGYMIGGGTSQAAPTMVGALALIVSAAKQTNVPHDARRVWLAVTNSARFVPHLGAHEQGHGIVDVAAAFELLRQYARTPPTITIEATGPVRTSYSRDLPVPHVGVGLYEREGWRPGMRANRILSLTRTSGPARAMTFGVSWSGNDGTFTAPDSVTLPLGVTVPLEIAVSPKSAGYHSAILNVGHPSVPGHVHRMLAAVVASQRFEASKQFTVSIVDTVERPGPRAYYLDVPQGSAALRVSWAADSARLWLKNPMGEYRYLTDASVVTTVPNPVPGVWEIVVRTANDGLLLRWASISDAPDPPFAVRITASVATISANVGPLGPTLMSNNAETTRDIQLENTQGRVTAQLLSAGLATERVVQGRLAPREQITIDINVAEGVQLLEVALPMVSQPAAVDLYLFECSSAPCVARASISGPTAERVFRHPAPNAGKWRVVVDASHAPATGVDYTYRDVILDPRLGGVSSTDVLRARQPGERWNATLGVWRSGSGVETGRTLSVPILVGVSSGAQQPMIPTFLRTLPLSSKN